MKLPARGVERVELSTWDAGDWWGSIDCDGGRTVSVLERLCGRLELGDMFQSDSSVVELIIGTASIAPYPWQGGREGMGLKEGKSLDLGH